MAEKSLLIVEDDKTLQDVLKYNFTKEGDRVLTASDGMQALNTARHEHPDAVEGADAVAAGTDLADGQLEFAFRGRPGRRP